MPSPIAPATGLQARLTIWSARRLYGEEAADVHRDLRPPSAPAALVRPLQPRGRAPWRGSRAADAPRRAEGRDRSSSARSASTSAPSTRAASGLTDAQLLALHDPEPSGLFSADELLVIAFAAAAHRDAGGRPTPRRAPPSTPLRRPRPHRADLPHRLGEPPRPPQHRPGDRARRLLGRPSLRAAGERGPGSRTVLTRPLMRPVVSPFLVFASLANHLFQKILL